MRIDQQLVDHLHAATVVDRGGCTIGGVGQVYLDECTGAPVWITVRRGFFYTLETFVPLTGTSYVAGRLTVPYLKSFIRHAPSMEAGGLMSDSQRAEAERYYAMDGAHLDNGAQAQDTSHHQAPLDQPQAPSPLRTRPGASVITPTGPHEQHLPPIATEEVQTEQAPSAIDRARTSGKLHQPARGRRVPERGHDLGTGWSDVPDDTTTHAASTGPPAMSRSTVVAAAP